MALRRFEFKDIRIIICMQGYPLDYHFYVREIGFWSRNLCGSIPLNCKINKNELDFYNQQTIYYFEEEVHGIKLKKLSENGLPSSDLKTILKLIYLLTASDESDSSYIAVCKEDKISGILSKANLGKFVLEIDSFDLFKRNGLVFPTNDIIRREITRNVEDYPICSYHETLKNNSIPLCSMSKAKFIANYCKQVLLEEQKNAQGNSGKITFTFGQNCP